MHACVCVCIRSDMFVCFCWRRTRFRDVVAETCFLELEGTEYELVKVNRKGTKCRVRCSGVDSSSTLPGCSDTTLSLTVKGNGDSCDLEVVGDTINGFLLDDTKFIFMDDGPNDR